MAGIRIPVSAELSTEDVSKAVAKFTQDFNRLGQSIAQANKVKFTPISKASLDDLKQVEAQYRTLLKVSGDLRQRVQSTNQQGAGFFGLNWEKLYPGELQRGFRMQQAFEHVGGARFSAPAGGGGGGGGHPSGGGGPGAGSALGGAVRQAVGAGLGAMGPAGRVADGALGAGMRGGIGAGLAGLGGGLAALAISKVVGATLAQVDKVITEDIKHDKIKRTLGDVGVGFGALKAAIRGSAAQTGLTFDDAQGLTMQYVREAGIGNREWRGVGEEVTTAANFGRSFGVDQSAAVGTFGMLRHFGVTGDDQQARKMALIIGESIAKSGAFAKSAEFLEAIAGYTEQQARQGMNAPNSAAFTALLAGMVSAKVPGMDVRGSAAMIGKVDSAIRNGGADEAGQNFMYRILGAKGWDPLDVRLLQDQGMFGDPSKTFGAGSVAGEFYRKRGISLPAGALTDSKASYTKFVEGLEAQYSGGPQMKKFMAAAFAKQTGMNITQAMAMLNTGPAQVGNLLNTANRLGLDITKVNATGISAAAQAENDAGLSREEKDARIRKAFAEGQEETQGSIARDSRAALENIKSTLADKLVPLNQAMRDGIMYMAGGNKGMSTRDIRVAMMTADSGDRERQIKGEFDAKTREAYKAVDDLVEQRKKALADVRRDWNDPEKRAAGQARVQQLSEQLAHAEEEKRQRLLKLQDDRAKAIEDERKALERNIKAIDDEEAARRKTREEIERASPAAAGAGRGFLNPQIVPGASSAETGSIDAQLADAERRNGLPPGTLKSIIQQETGGRTAEFLADPTKYHYGLDASGRRIAGHTGKVSTAFGPFGILESTGAKPGYGVTPLKDKSIGEQIRFAAEYLAARRNAAGSLAGGLAGYGEGNGYASSVMARLGGGTPIPDTGDVRPGDRDQRIVVQVAPGEFRLVDERGKQVAQTQVQASAHINNPAPSGVRP